MGEYSSGRRRKPPKRKSHRQLVRRPLGSPIRVRNPALQAARCSRENGNMKLNAEVRAKPLRGGVGSTVVLFSRQMPEGGTPFTGVPWRPPQCPPRPPRLLSPPHRRHLQGTKGTVAASGSKTVGSVDEGFLCGSLYKKPFFFRATACLFLCRPVELRHHEPSGGG